MLLLTLCYHKTMCVRMFMEHYSDVKDFDNIVTKYTNDITINYLQFSGIITPCN